MRLELSNISRRLNIPLLHCDMLPYPNKQTIDFGLAEETMILAAGGIAIYKPVFVYGVCGFIAGRYNLLKTLTQTNYPIYFFNAGGSNNPCYAHFGKGHIFNEDLKIAELLGFTIYTPDHYKDLRGIIEVTLPCKNHKFIRLGKDFK